MATTNFVKNETYIEADWLNDVNDLVYEGKSQTPLKGQTYATLQAMVEDVANFNVGDTAYILERTSGNGGGAYWKAIDATTSPGNSPNTYDIVAGNAMVAFQLLVDSVADAAQFGAVPDLSTDSGAAINAADSYAATNDVSFKLIGQYYTTVPITITAKNVLLDCEIKKNLADEEVISFAASVKSVLGRCYVYNSTKPTIETNAVGYLLKDNIHTTFACSLSSDRIYSGVKTWTGGTTNTWGNFFSEIYVRDFVSKALDFSFAGSGALTENFIAVCYINGKLFDGPTYAAIISPVIEINNAEGLAFGTLNIEWCELTSAGNYFNVLNESTLSIRALHFEGNKISNTGDNAIFNVSAAGVTANVNINNVHMNNVVQSTGRLFLCKLSNTPKGAFKVSSFSGLASSNTITDYRILFGNSANEYTVTIEDADNYADYFTSQFAGSMLADYRPSIYFRTNPVSISVSVANYSLANIDTKKGRYITFTGTFPASITDLSATQEPGENTRTITLYNNAANSQIVNTGNIDIGGRTSPVAWNAGTNATFLFDFNRNKAALIGVG